MINWYFLIPACLVGAALVMILSHIIEGIRQHQFMRDIWSESNGMFDPCKGCSVKDCGECIFHFGDDDDEPCDLTDDAPTDTPIDEIEMVEDDD